MEKISLKKLEIKSGELIIVKVGSRLLAKSNGELNNEKLSNICLQIANLKRKYGLKIILVSSGAILAGKSALNRSSLEKIEEQQLAASVGQVRLINSYETLFAKEGFNISQFLLTKEDLDDRHKYFNLFRCLSLSLKNDFIPIINENDALSYSEIQFGDNDFLASLLAKMVKARLVIFLSTVDGIFAEAKSEENRIYQNVAQITDQSIKELQEAKPAQGSKGGIGSKLTNMISLAKDNIASVLFNGSYDDCLEQILSGAGTWSYASKDEKSERMTSIRRFIKQGKSSGQLKLDNGACEALLENKKSLLASGIKSVSGQFKRGDIIDLLNPDNELIAKGISNYSNDEVVRLKGLNSNKIMETLGYNLGDEMIHRDYLMLWSNDERNP